jgi:hypothetical protein
MKFYLAWTPVEADREHLTPTLGRRSSGKQKQIHQILIAHLLCFFL